MRRSNGTLAATTCESPRESTIEWMVTDIAERCRDVLDALAHPSHSSVQLGSAAMLLRGAADDLVSTVELIEGPTEIQDRLESHHGSSAFDLVFQQLRRGGVDSQSLSGG